MKENGAISDTDLAQYAHSWSGCAQSSHSEEFRGAGNHHSQH